MTSWWGGRDLTALLQELFLEHFTDTCFVVEKDGELVGFLVGFLSQSRADEAYIHFVGVHPDFRKEKIATALYERFFDICKRHGRAVVRGCTSLVNTGSAAFHERMGFHVERGPHKFYFTKRLKN